MNTQAFENGVAKSYLVGTTIACLLFFTLICFFNLALLATWEAWQQEEYSHGYLIPLVGLMLLFNHKQNKRQLKKTNSWLGFIAVLSCLFFESLFIVSGVHGLQPFLLVVFFLSLFVLFYGVRYAFLFAGPLFFFFFLAPLPKFLYYTLSVKMQMLSTTISVYLLELSSISVYQDGNVVDLGFTQLQVVEACNGLRYLFPLMALGYLLAYMYKTTFIKRSFLFLSTIPITILMNSFRIYLIGVSASFWGPEVAEGLVHDVEGWVMFLGCLLVLGGEVFLFQLIGKKGEIDFDTISFPSRKSLAVLFPAPIQRPVKLAAVVCLVFIGGYVSLGWMKVLKIAPVLLEKSLNEFPMQLGDWRGLSRVMDQAYLDVLGTDEYLLADYMNSQGDSVNLYMLYFSSQDSTSNQAVHTPEVCIPSGGWEIVSQTKSTIELENGVIQPVNKLIIAKGLQRHLVYYWFFQGNETTLDEVTTRLSVIKHSILEHRTNGGMIRLTTSIPSQNEVTVGEKKLKKFFIEVVHPSFPLQ